LVSLYDGVVYLMNDSGKTFDTVCTNSRL